MNCSAAAVALALAITTSVIASCSCSRKSDPSPASIPSEASAEPDFTAGDPVVVETARALFVEGVVRRPGKTRLQVDVPDAGAPREVDAVNVYALKPRKEGAAWPSGTLAICRVAPLRWVGCRIGTTTGDKVSIADENGAKFEIEITNILQPTAVTELNLRQSFEQALKRKAFLDGARDAGRPQVLKGWTAKAGDHVLVASGETYVAGRVQKIKRGQVYVLVEGAGNEPRPFARSDVFPQPPVVFTPTAASYACVRPSPGETTWQIVRIESSSEGKVTVSDALGHKRTAEVRDLIPLAK